MEGCKFNLPADDTSVSRIQNLFFLFVALLTGVLIAILVSLTPPGADDLLFLLPAKGHDPGPGLWSMMTGEFGRIWETQSGRLGNFLALPMLYLFPKWVTGIITGGLTTLLILLSCRITETRRGSIVSWLIYATLVLAYPWYDFLTLTTYAINYIWAATAAVAAIACFLNLNSIQGLRFAAACLLMFIAGWMHEGFGAPMTTGLALSLLLHLKKAGPRRILACICAGAGTCMTLLSPTFWMRSETETRLLQKLTYPEMLMQIGPAMLFVVTMTILIIVISSIKESRKQILSSSRFLIFAGASIAATAVCLKFYTGPRTGAPAILFSALACAYMLTAVSYRIHVCKSINATAGILIGGFSILHLLYADVAQTRQTEEYREITRLYEESEEGIFYYDLTYPKVDLSLYKTSVRQFHERVPKEFMRMYFRPDQKMVILPTALEGFNPGKATKSVLTPGVLMYNGWPVVPDSVETDSFHRIHILTEKGEYLPSRFRVDRFDCPSYGKFILVTPHIKVLDPTLQIQDISLYDHSR